MNVKKYDVMMDEDQRPVLKETSIINFGKYKNNHVFQNAPSIVEFLTDGLNMDKMMEEYVMLIGLDSKCHILGVSEVGHGNQNMAFSDTANIFRRLILMGAAFFIIAHNHPSGNPTPSSKDKELTENLKKAGELMEIPLADHIIISGKTSSMTSSFYSFFSEEK